MSKDIVSNLKIALADSYILLLKTQNYHWNVTGPNFQSLHLMFESQYNDLFAAVDSIAERIKALGGTAPGSFLHYGKITNIIENDTKISADEMVKDLANDQQKIIASLAQVMRDAQKIGDEVTSGMMASRIEMHQKNAWMLRSTIFSS